MKGSDRLSMPSAEGGEIVSADQQPCCPVHGLDIQRSPDPERETLVQRTAGAGPDGVPIFPLPGGVARLETQPHADQWAYGDVPWEHRIQRPSELIPRESSLVREGDHLPAGVDARVGPARAIDPDATSVRQAGECRFEFSLDGPALALQLEAAELRAVVFDPRAVAHEAALSGSCLALAQTSSSWTMGAASPARGPRRITLVKPEVRSP